MIVTIKIEQNRPKRRHMHTAFAKQNLTTRKSWPGKLSTFNFFVLIDEKLKFFSRDHNIGEAEMTSITTFIRTIGAYSVPVMMTGLLAACGGDDNDNGGGNGSSSSSSSTSSTSSSSTSSSSTSSSSSSSSGGDEFPPPNAEWQEPAFEEQTRAPRVQSDITLAQETIASGLQNPWSLEFLPSGRVIVSERPGRIRIVSQHGDLSDPLLGVPDVDSRNQGGMLDLALHPNFAENRFVYFSYAESRGDNETGTSVARGRLSDDETALENVEVIFRQTPSWESTLHYGSRLVWGTDGSLYITLGERSNPEPRQLAQDLTTYLGKVVRVNDDGSAPDDNPFANDDNGNLPLIWSYGHRNLQGATLHPETGQLWTVEHGPRGGDELNIPEAGKNYGWPIITYGEDYSGVPIGDGITQQEGMEQPLYYWDPVIAPGGITFYTGMMFNDWQGDLLISSLNPGGVVRLELNDENIVTAEERLLTDVGRVRDTKVGPQGGIWIVTDDQNGQLIKLTITE